MRRLLCALLLLVATAPAQKPAVTSSAPPPPPAGAPLPIDDENARRAKALLDQMLKALGGNAYLGYRSRTEVGRTYRFYHGEPQGVGVQFWRFWRYPDRDRMELTKQRDWVVIYKGDEAWETTFRGTALLDREDLREYLRRREYSNERVLREWLKTPGTVLFYDGMTVAERRPAEKITIMDAQNRSVTFFISTDTHLPIKKTFTLRDPETRERSEEEEIYDNYRNIQGIQTPLSWTWKRDQEMTRQRFLNTVAYDPPMADALFQAGPVNYDWRKK
jgi:hypothetical protein